MSVLHLRGLSVTQQPIESPRTGSLLLWNGEVFEGLSLSDTENDGKAVLDSLENRGERSVPEVFVDIEGPYSFIYYDASLKQVWFGRDPLGRRSLMKIEQEGHPHRPYLSIASLFKGEIARCSSEIPTDSLFYVDLKNVQAYKSICQIARMSSPIVLNRQVPSESDRVFWDGLNSSSSSSLLAAADRLRESLHISLRRRLSSISSLYRTDCHESKVAILFSGGLDCTTLAMMAHLHLPPTEPIDLINVAFENPRVASNLRRNSKANNVDTFSVPDRHTGESSWKELCKLTTGRTWRFVKVDVCIADYLQWKEQIIELMRPNATVMDLSIAAALFFAARGIGSCSSDPILNEFSQPAYRSPARVLLSGLGADELLGGYSRHRSAFCSPTPWITLIDELQLDIDRIPTRNLGRDDRIIAHFSREVRYPFLDREVINTLAALPVHLKCDLSLGKGTGDKLLLRVLAHDLGLSQASKLVKRAIQFGARSAKLEGLEKGTAELSDTESQHATFESDLIPAGWEEWFFNRAPRLTIPEAKIVLSKLLRTAQDEQTGCSPMSLEVSKLTFSSFPAGQTVILGHPQHIKVTEQIAENSHSLVLPSKPYYEMKHISNKGIGMLATRDISCGSIIISERPGLILPERLEAPSCRLLDNVHLVVFDELAYDLQRHIAALAPAVPDDDQENHPLVNRIWNNEICIPINAHDPSQKSFLYSAVYPTMSRFNHSCTPNSRWHFDSSTFSLQLSAVRKIEQQEEITVSYIDHLCDRVGRQEKLSKWNFECRCPACDLTIQSLAEVQASDTRREVLNGQYSLAQEFLRASSAAYCHDDGSCQALIKRMDHAISLVREERLFEELATFGRALVRLYAYTGRMELAQKHAMDCFLVVAAVEGKESGACVELEKMLKKVDPGFAS